MNELLIHTTWMNLNGISLSERRQSQNITYCMISLYDIFEKIETIVMEDKLIVIRT